ncbi:MAG: tetratricopeptide repeat protein [Myxococcota bacterium]
MTSVQTIELAQALAYANHSIGQSDWEHAQQWAKRALVIDDESPAALFCAARATFERGENRTPSRWFEAAISKNFHVAEAYHYLALIALRQGQQRSARTLFAQALQLGQDSYEARIALAQDAEPSVAIEHLLKAVAFHPTDGEANFLLGKILFERGDKQAAIAPLRLALAAELRAPKANFLLGQIFFEQSDWSRAREHYQAAYEGGESTAESLYLLGTLFEKTDASLAFKYYKSARSRHSKALDLDLRLGRVAESLSLTRDAYSAFRRALNGEHRTEALLGLAHLFLKDGNTAQAAKYFSLALDAGHDDYVSRMTLAKDALNRRRRKDALEHYQGALAIQPGDPQASLEIGELLMALGRSGGAIPHLQAALSGNTSVGKVHVLMGRAYGALGDDMARLESFAHAAALRVEEPEVYRSLALAYDAEPTSRGAEALWAETLRLAPGDREAKLRLASLLVERGAFDEAGEYLAQLTRTQYRSEAHRLLGVIARARSLYKEALAHDEIVLKMSEPTFDLLMGMGESAQRLGRPEVARTYYARAQAFRPQDPKVSFLLGEVCLDANLLDQAEQYLNQAQAGGYRTGRVGLLLQRIADERVGSR